MITTVRLVSIHDLTELRILSFMMQIFEIYSNNFQIYSSVSISNHGIASFLNIKIIRAKESIQKSNSMVLATMCLYLQP